MIKLGAWESSKAKSGNADDAVMSDQRGVATQRYCEITRNMQIRECAGCRHDIECACGKKRTILRSDGPIYYIVYPAGEHCSVSGAPDSADFQPDGAARTQTKQASLSLAPDADSNQPTLIRQQ